MTTFIVTQIRGNFQSDPPHAVVTVSQVGSGDQAGLHLDFDEAGGLAVGSEYRLEFVEISDEDPEDPSAATAPGHKHSWVQQVDTPKWYCGLCGIDYDGWSAPK